VTPAVPTPGAALDDVRPGLDQLLDDEVRALLDRWSRRYRARPGAERRRLLLLALEREQIVSFAYREEVLAARIAALRVPEDVRTLVRRALAWAQRDEALHVEWVRGRLRGERRPVALAVLLGLQVKGLVSGWVTTGQPGGRRAAGSWSARLVVDAARLTRRVHPELVRALRAPGLRAYCELNVALERTAERCWARLAELTTGTDRRDAERICADEGRHRAVFAVLASVLDDHDGLLPGITVAGLTERLGAVGPWFLPAEHRGQAPRAVGSGAPVTTAGGFDPRAALREVLAATLRDVAGRSVAVRASFMLGYDVRDRSNVGDVELLDELARVLRAAGARDVAVLEAPTVYDRFVRHRSVAEVAERFGYTSPHYRVVDVQADQVACDYPRGLGRSTISRTWLQADRRIVLAKATTDPVEWGHLSLSRLEGTGGRVDETMHVDRLTDFRSALMMVLDLAPPDLAVVDAWGPVADGPVGVMGSHRPCYPRRVYGGVDALSVDVAVLADMGCPDPRRLPGLAAAATWLGMDLPEPVVLGPTGRWGGGYRGPASTLRDRLVCATAYPVYAYGGLHGERFLPRFDPAAFPYTHRARPDIRLVRALVQRVFGLHPGSA
jgi:hypothetical protein